MRSDLLGRPFHARMAVLVRRLARPTLQLGRSLVDRCGVDTHPEPLVRCDARVRFGCARLARTERQTAIDGITTSEWVAT